MQLPSFFKELYPFHSYALDVGGCNLHYVNEGRGRPVVLVHGNPTWSFYFRELIKGLREGFRVVAPDHIGCGLSDKPQDYAYTLATHIENFSRLMDHLGLEDITLGVHDWGGPIGLGWAVKNPKRVRSLVIFNTAAFLGGTMPRRIRMSRWPIIGGMGVRRMNLFAKSALQLACMHQDRMIPDVVEGYLHPYDCYENRVGILRFVQDIPFNSRVPSHAVMAEIERNLPALADKPMTIFWGGQDFVFTDKYLESWKERFPAATVHRFADAGHYVVEDAYERILPLLREFLQ